MTLFSSQGQVNSAVGAKEHSRVHLCLRLALRKPGSHSTRLSALGPNWRGWYATEHTLTWKASNNLWSEQLSPFLKKCCVLLLMTDH
ncbi:unnamed protein product [Nezara viridula]|uniref:Uncharacterized protein n=1 Tax=Nezara viridula TaxID=85310 RepID=A0A9P0H364_NEZVI|nr:unnamed protein product [Nezara viridula]